MKPKRYWIWGGVIAAILFVLNSLIAFAEFLSCFEHPCGLIAVLPSYEIQQYLTHLLYPIDDDIAFWVIAIVVIAVGCLIGLLYGKIRNRNNT
jgi:hypothetical protein